MALSLTVKIAGEVVLENRGSLELLDVGLEGHGVFWWNPESANALPEKIAINSTWMQLADDVRVRISPNRPQRGRRTVIQVDAPRDKVPIYRVRSQAKPKPGPAGNGPEVVRRPR